MVDGGIVIVWGNNQENGIHSQVSPNKGPEWSIGKNQMKTEGFS